jgi:hypothetical protein
MNQKGRKGLKVTAVSNRGGEKAEKNLHLQAQGEGTKMNKMKQEVPDDRKLSKRKTPAELLDGSQFVCDNTASGEGNDFVLALPVL